MKKITTSLLSISALLIAAQALAADDSVTINVSHQQSISVSNPSDTSGNAGNVMSATWTVSSNNGFDIAFSGSSHDETGSTVNHPNFDKQDVDAAGNVLAGQYDVLDTRWGVVISGAESTETGTQWGGAANPTANDAGQGGDGLVGSGPDTAIGTIMTGDTTGTADVSLYVRGTATDGSVPSGNYSTTVTLTVSADEQVGGSTVESPSQPACTTGYCDNDDGTITDSTTGLVGLKNANCFGGLNWDAALSAAANLASGQCGLTDGSSVGDWRLLTKDELLIYVAWKYSGQFIGVQASAEFNNYWSSTNDTNSTGKAWDAHLVGDNVLSHDKNLSFFVWPVRGGL